MASDDATPIIDYDIVVLNPSLQAFLSTTLSIDAIYDLNDSLRFDE